MKTPNDVSNGSLSEVSNIVESETPKEILGKTPNETPNKRKTIWNSREIIDAVSDDNPMQTYQKLKKID
ncbi:hypothetical protein J6T66_04470 [bacterium]|nr:hypothetical protein [bacterium]